jgi:IS1 family transposase
MAYVLKKEKQVQIIGGLVEGASIRSLERQTGVHRDTIMRLGVRMGKAAGKLMDEKMRELPCENVQVDEIWGFIGKKQKNVALFDSPAFGDVYTFVAIDRETKLIPSYYVGKRDTVSATEFMRDLASRMKNRIQLSSDGLNAYITAVEDAFGANVDYGQIVKVYTPAEDLGPRRYSPLKMVTASKETFVGRPVPDQICTSHVESQNLTMRMHCRRLTRLTNAFSKKLENFEAAISLHFAYYNFVKPHATLKMTPAMAAGVESSQWTLGNLLEYAEAQ